jgi:hypothetical protein
MTSRAKAEEREWVIWGGPCRLCGFLICECPEYRYAEGGSKERLRRMLRLNGLHLDLYGVRMDFNDIKGVCPICNQSPAGFSSNFEGLGKPESVMVKCSNGHWQPLESWKKMATPEAPVVSRPGDMYAKTETSTMIQNPEPEVDPLAPAQASVHITVSRSALELLRADFNPDKNLKIGQIKLVIASLVTECERLRDRPRLPEQDKSGQVLVPNVSYNADCARGARNAANAITALETAMMHIEKAVRAVKECT